MTVAAFQKGMGMSSWLNDFSALPLIAILRGVRPDEVLAVGAALYEEGFRLVEVPLNSPDPLRSIGMLAAEYAGRMTIGGGTVLSADQVDAIKGAGGQLIVSPNLDSRVAARSSALEMTFCPGVMTPTEAFQALDQGAAAIKIFPAELVPPIGLKAMKAVLPNGVRTIPVGGITPDTMADYLNVGASGFGLGSALYKPGDTAEDVRGRARQFVSRFQEIRKTV